MSLNNNQIEIEKKVRVRKEKNAQERKKGTREKVNPQIGQYCPKSDRLD